MKRSILGVAVVLVLSLASASTAQNGIAITGAFAREIVVTGTAPVGSGPITIMNVQFPAEYKLGTGNVASDGSFAVALQEPLVEGHGLVAINQAGGTSPRFTVAKARSGDTPGTPPSR